MNTNWLKLSAAVGIWTLVMLAKLANAQTNFTILRSVGGAPDASIAYSTLVADSNGVLYGTTFIGGISNKGAIFSLNQIGTGYRLLCSFVVTNGAEPYAGLALASDGRLYGTTYAGGISNFGTVFGINTDGSGLATLHGFTGSTDGKNPETSLIEGNDGALYGTTYNSDSVTHGTVFKINKDGSGYSILHPFAGIPDGQQVEGRLLQGSDGALYGTTAFGGTHGAGTVFTINEDGSGYNVLYSFHTTTPDGGEPIAGLLEGSDHVLYGTCYVSGGTGVNGTLYKINKDGSGYQTIHPFSTTGGDGQQPDGDLIEGPDGTLYGGTQFGGTGSSGTIYKMNKDATGYTILRSFLSSGGDAQEPKCALLRLNNGALYGTSEFGGLSGAGCVFALSTNALPPLITSLVTSASSNTVQCATTSATQYDIQRSTNLLSWALAATLVSGTNGQINYTDSNPPQSGAYYRLQQH